MNGYAGSLHELAEGYDISVRQTPPARADALHDYLSERFAAVDRALPPDELPNDQKLYRSLVVGLLDQIAGLPDYDNMHAVHEMERHIAALEYECDCPGGENTMRRVICTDRRGKHIVTPANLVSPLLVLANETTHAEQLHLPRLLQHLDHCPSFRPGIKAVKLLEDVLSTALLLLVGDNPQQAADRILMGETSFVENGY